jgi:hypothetical protein
MSPTPPAPPRWTHTGRRLGRALLGLVAAVVVVVTLEPFRFAWPASLRLVWWDTPTGVALNVALFVPLGFLAALTPGAVGAARDARAGWRLLRIGALAALTSASIEAVQLLEPARYPSGVDLASNTVGALLGAWAHGRLARRLGADSALVGRLALELPIMGLVYVALPLATLAAATLADAPTPVPGSVASLVAPRTLGLLALAGFAGALLGSVQRQRLGPDGLLGRRGAALAATAWTALAGVPALATRPVTYLAAMALAATTAWVVAGVEAFVVERRFEREAIGRAAPWLAAYLLLLPLGNPATALPAGAEPPPLLILRRVEWGVGFVVLGYLLAEAWGRRELRFRAVGWRVALVAAGVAVVLGSLAVGIGTGGAGLGTGTLGVARPDTAAGCTTCSATTCGRCSPRAARPPRRARIRRPTPGAPPPERDAAPNGRGAPPSGGAPRPFGRAAVRRRAAGGQGASSTTTWKCAGWRSSVACTTPSRSSVSRARRIHPRHPSRGTRRSTAIPVGCTESSDELARRTDVGRSALVTVSGSPQARR